MNKSAIVAKLLGEAEAAAIDVPAEQAAEAGSKTSPNVDALAASWKQGNRQAVAIRVLDALDSYEDFVRLLFRLGETDGVELGAIMDELTSEEVSPHEFDEYSDEMAVRMKNRPTPDTPGVMGAAESLNPTQIWLKRLKAR